jgi:DNA polymerase-3 subunit epsilon
MGKWYLERLETVEGEDEDIPSVSEFAVEPNTQRRSQTFETTKGIVVYVHPEIGVLRSMVAAARSRLAEIEADYTKDHCAVEATQARLFNLVREHYQRRDRLRLLVDHRRKYLEVLISSGEEEAAEVEANYQKASAQSEANYDGAARAAANKKELSAEQETEVKTLWKKLVLLYHPDRHAGEADTFDTYEKLMSAINRAKEEGDIELLREIASGPNSFILRQGWTALDLSEANEIASLRKLLDTLNAEIINKLEALNNLRESSDYDLHQRCQRQSGLLDEVAADLAKAISAEIARLETEAEKLKGEIAELVGTDAVPAE